MTIKELLSDESKWTQGCFAMDDCGSPIGPNHPKARCWCLSGAVSRVYHDRRAWVDATSRLELAVQARGFRCVSAFNDFPKTTFVDVRDVINEADV